jgi:hypothetical protein
LRGNETDSENTAIEADSQPCTETASERAETLYERTRRLIALELAPAERLLWTGHPFYQGWKFRALDFLLIPLGIVASVGAMMAWVGLIAMVWGHVPGATDRIGQEINGLLNALIAVSAEAAGFYLTIGRLMLDARRRANTSYGLTPHRIIIISGWLKRNVASIALDTLDLGQITFSRHDDGSGTIRFGEPSRLLRPWHLPGLPVTAQPEFERVANVLGVLHQITQAQRGTLASSDSFSHRSARRPAARMAHVRV